MFILINDQLLLFGASEKKIMLNTTDFHSLYVIVGRDIFRVLQQLNEAKQKKLHSKMQFL